MMLFRPPLTMLMDDIAVCINGRACAVIRNKGSCAIGLEVVAHIVFVPQVKLRWNNNLTLLVNVSPPLLPANACIAILIIADPVKLRGKQYFAKRIPDAKQLVIQVVADANQAVFLDEAEGDNPCGKSDAVSIKVNQRVRVLDFILGTDLIGSKSVSMDEFAVFAVSRKGLRDDLFACFSINIEIGAIQSNKDGIRRVIPQE